MDSPTLSALFGFLLGLVSAAITWAFHEFSQSRRLSEARRAEINRAIFILLELRHCLRATTAVCEHLASKLSIDPRLLEREIRPRVIGLVLPPNAPANYAKAIDALAAHDPFLAYTLSGHGRLPEIINLPQFVRTHPSSSGPEFEAFAQSLHQFSIRLSDAVADGGIETLEGAILTLAKASSSKLKRDLRIRFAEGGAGLNLNVPETEHLLAQVDKWIAELLALSTSASSTRAAASPPVR